MIGRDGDFAARAPWVDTGSRPAVGLGVAVIGTGRWGVNLVRAFSSLERVRVEAAYDVDPLRLAGLPESIDRAHGLDELLARADVDAVVIATPPHTHAGLALSALAAGKHVFVEKPMATSLADALRIRSAALAARRRVMVGLVLHYHPAVGALMRLVEQGALGRVVRLYAERGGGRRPAAEHPPWWSLAPHDISLAQSVFRCRAASVSVSQAGGVVTGEVCFRRGRKALISLHDRMATRRRRVIIVGSTAVAVFDDLEPHHKLQLHRCNCSETNGLAGIERAIARHSADVIATAGDEPLRLEVEHFVDCVLGDAPCVTGIDHAVDVVSVLASGERSLADRGVSVAVTPWRSRAAD